MELKQTKPIHLRCPKCGYDFSYNTNHIEESIDTLKCEITDIKSQLERFNAEHPNPAERRKNTWRRNAQVALSVKNAQLQKLKKQEKQPWKK